MTDFLRSGNRFDVSARGALDFQDSLPAGTYTAKFDPHQGFYLEVIEDFNISGKLYGNTTERAERILNTFSERPSGTGVLLTGDKGSGKTMLAKLLAIKAQEEGIPTIVINQPWHGEGFNLFIQSIEQPAIILFDEFEKVYNREEQEKMLTLLDGVYPTKKLFILTSNNVHRIDDNMKNRPGRLYYRIDYTGLDRDFIEEYTTDNLLPEQAHHLDAILNVSTLFPSMNFDILKALVEEVNRYGETPQEALQMLNAKPDEVNEHATFLVTVTEPGSAEPKPNNGDNIWTGNPLAGTVLWQYSTGELDEYGDSIWKELFFNSQNLQVVDGRAGRFVFVNAEGIKLELTKKKPETPHWHAY